MKDQTNMKPIRWYEETRIHWWGCPKCDMKYGAWESLWYHTKNDHGFIIGDYHEARKDYVLKELKR